MMPKHVSRRKKGESTHGRKLLFYTRRGFFLNIYLDGAFVGLGIHR